jgi:hypothetical protein
MPLATSNLPLLNNKGKQAATIAAAAAASNSKNDAKTAPLAGFAASLSHAQQTKRLDTELTMCKQLLAISPNCKWVLLTVGVLLGAVASLKSLSSQHEKHDEQQQSATATATAAAGELRAIATKLLELDPMRATYYAQWQSSIAAQLA